MGIVKRQEAFDALAIYGGAAATADCAASSASTSVSGAILALELGLNKTNALCRAILVENIHFTGSASLSVLFGLIGRLADKREHAKEHGLGSWAGRADCWGRAGWRLLGDLGRGTGSRLLSRMPRAVDASAQPILPSSSRPPGARRRRDGEGAGEPLAMSEP